MSVQTQIVAFAGRNGDLDGYNDDELLARQVLKFCEELGELASTVDAEDPELVAFFASLTKVGGVARRLFKDRASCVNGALVHTGQARSELADIGVVLAVAAHALTIPDAMQAAHAKALADIPRGVRA